MKKEVFMEMLRKANKLENYRHNTIDIEYYSMEEPDFSDLSDDDKEHCFMYQILANDTVLLTDMDRSLFTAYLDTIGKTFEQQIQILAILFRYNNIDLDYCHFGTYKELLQYFEYKDEWLDTTEPYAIKKEVLKILSKILDRKVKLTGYTQNRDIRFGETYDQLEFEEEAFKEDGKRMSEYTTADSYEITENYVCSYYNEVSLSANFLRLMRINRTKGFRCKISSGKDLQIFNRIALYAIKDLRLMRISGIETFIALIQKLYANDGYLTKSDIETFNNELNYIIKQVEDPETYKYIMMDVSDLTPGMWNYEDCLLLYSKVCRSLDLTNLDIVKLIDDREFAEDILNELDMEEIPYYEDNLDYQEDEDCIPVMAE